eukprot:TRINITY_DN7856_c0_g1_i2.p1 TRINITY_DN7856_c0_g1~~TRINITY_DN7856_c0_g1_i2.p1  ORF type:complete len:180 (-),score=17.80 TRINITY_DN7856_c0_g1_i2:227-766(-)
MQVRSSSMIIDSAFLADIAKGLVRKDNEGVFGFCDSELHQVLMNVAAHYRCHSCVLSVLHTARMHVVAVAGSGHLTFEQEIPLLDEGEFQLFYHHLRRPLPVIIQDASGDKRAEGDAFDVGGLTVRFYAAAPIYYSSQECYGTLCIVDDLPRPSFSLREAGHLCEQAADLAKIMQELRS